MIATLSSQTGLQYVASLSPAVWYRYGVSVTTASWSDQSGNGRTLTFTNSPTVDANGVTFNGTNQYGKTLSFTFSQPLTEYLLMKQITWTNADTFCDGDTAASLLIQQGGASPFMNLYAGSGVASNGDLALGNFGVVAAVFNGASSSLQINNGTPTTGNPGAGNAGGFTLGAGATPGNHSNITVKEVILFPAAHDAATRARVVRYLMQVGGL